MTDSNQDAASRHQQAIRELARFSQAADHGHIWHLHDLERGDRSRVTVNYPCRILSMSPSAFEAYCAGRPFESETVMVKQGSNGVIFFKARESGERVLVVDLEEMSAEGFTFHDLEARFGIKPRFSFFRKRDPRNVPVHRSVDVHVFTGTELVVRPHHPVRLILLKPREYEVYRRGFTLTTNHVRVVSELGPDSEQSFLVQPGRYKLVADFGDIFSSPDAPDADTIELSVELRDLPLVTGGYGGSGAAHTTSPQAPLGGTRFTGVATNENGTAGNSVQTGSPPPAASF